MADDDKDFFQHLAGECIDLLTWVGDNFGDPVGREAILKDLGGAPLATDPPSISAGQASSG